MEINEVSSAAAVEPQRSESNAALQGVRRANEQIEQTGEQALQVLESTAPGKLRVGPVTTLGLNLDLKA